MSWTVHDICQATGGAVLHATRQDTPDHAQHADHADHAVTGIAIDSRATEAGDLFIALKGPRHDGHDFIAHAIWHGAVAVLMMDAQAVTKVTTPSADTGPATNRAAVPILVGDTREGLIDLAQAAIHRHASHGKRIAITGSVGKTGSRMLLETALAPHAPDKTHASRGNLNNHIGVPLSVARMPEDAQFAIFEVGMNAPGEIAPLSRLIAPHIAVITRIADSHLGNFASTDDIAKEKGEIFRGLAENTSPQTIALINSDDGYAKQLTTVAKQSGSQQIFTCGKHASADYRLLSVQRTNTGLEVECAFPGQPQPLRFPMQMSAAHWAHAGMLALAVVDCLGLPLTPSITALASAQDMRGRGRRLPCLLLQDETNRLVEFTLIDDAYNASPASMRAALLGLKTDPATILTQSTGTGSRRIQRVAVLGDMLELGDDATAKRQHAELIDAVMDAELSLLIGVGPLMATLIDAANKHNIETIHAKDYAEAFRYLRSLVRHGDVVLVKASHGSELWKLVDGIEVASKFARDANGQDTNGEDDPNNGGNHVA